MVTDDASQRVESKVSQAHSARRNSGFIAWPTILLLVLALCIWSVNLWALITGLMPIALGAFVTILSGYISFTPFHEATHGNISGKSKNHILDKTVGWLGGIPFWAPFTSFVLVHLTHHSNTNDPEKDPDYWVFSRNKLEVALRCLSVYPNYLKHIFYLIPKRGHKVGTIQIQMVLYLSVVAAAVAYGFHSGWGWEILLGWVAPGFITHGLLSWTLDFLPHFPHEDRTRYGQTRVLRGPGLRVLLLGQDLHIIHHMFPMVPFYRYKNVFEEIEPALREHNIRETALIGD